MDTRTKIITASESAVIATSCATVVSGSFDPLTAAHAERLAGLKRPLLVLIADPENPILPALARAQLVAGLAVVDHVAISSPHCPVATIRLEQEHAALFEALLERVHARQSVSPGPEFNMRASVGQVPDLPGKISDGKSGTCPTLFEKAI